MKLSRLGLLLGDGIKKTGAWDPNRGLLVGIRDCFWRSFLWIFFLDIAGIYFWIVGVMYDVDMWL